MQAVCVPKAHVSFNFSFRINLINYLVLGCFSLYLFIYNLKKHNLGVTHRRSFCCWSVCRIIQSVSSAEHMDRWVWGDKITPPGTNYIKTTLLFGGFLKKSVLCSHSKKCWVISTQLWVKYGLTQLLG